MATCGWCGVCMPHMATIRDQRTDRKCNGKAWLRIDRYCACTRHIRFYLGSPLLTPLAQDFCQAPLAARLSIYLHYHDFSAYIEASVELIGSRWLARVVQPEADAVLPRRARKILGPRATFSTAEFTRHRACWLSVVAWQKDEFTQYGHPSHVPDLPLRNVDALYDENLEITSPDQVSNRWMYSAWVFFRLSGKP